MIRLSTSNKCFHTLEKLAVFQYSLDDILVNWQVTKAELPVSMTGAPAELPDSFPEAIFLLLMNSSTLSTVWVAFVSA